MTESYPEPDAGGDMRRIGTSDPDGDSLTFTLDDSTDTVEVTGTLRTVGFLDTTNPGKGTKKEDKLANLLVVLHEAMVKHQQPCQVKIEFKFAGGDKRKRVRWRCSAHADWSKRVNV